MDFFVSEIFQEFGGANGDAVIWVFLEFVWMLGIKNEPGGIEKVGVKVFEINGIFSVATSQAWGWSNEGNVDFHLGIDFRQGDFSRRRGRIGERLVIKWEQILKD